MRGLTKNYGDLCAVSDLNLDIEQGEAICLLGPNGAGKSATLNLMLGLTKPDRGTVDILGNANSSRSARQLVGYVAQDCDFPPNLTVREILQLVRTHYPNPMEPEALIADFGLGDLADRSCGGFSGGQRRRLALALAFAGRGKIVVLDEPTTGLDTAARKAFWAYAQNYVADGGTLIVTTHHLEEIESVASRICLIDHGRICLEGPVDHIRDSIGQKYIRFRCDSLPKLEPVSHAAMEEGMCQIISSDADSIVRQLVASGVSFADLEIRNASLEEAIDLLTFNAGETA